ncbi:DUF6163 family protein [Mesorhizobium sp. LHD-90]|uniref:DUF6163 family protein n=1 Tax=Mesorhizobium sp. LHD-90 TaxID=3071414 RepID=UPI0027DFA33F|nr:DUF6163 family protein [Mesorhizobium sp. LHD-90]MDQ6432886.1 DUF6163 family protein [Mesorhizobium sp. LHD-90]
MSDTSSDRRNFGPTVVEQLFAWFQRIIAVYCLMFGVLYWVRLLGYYDSPLWRIDLMPVHWQVVTVTLAVFFPFAAAGLWMLASWGPVIWFLCAATETVMYAGFPDLFGRHYAVVASHAFAACLYTAFRLVIHFQKRTAAQQ